MKILVTGHSGFIGSHICPQLEAQGHTVYKLKNDLLDCADVSDEVYTLDPDVIVHLGARTEVGKSFYEPIAFSQVNYVGTVNLVNAAVKLKNLKCFIFASTMEVYGWQPVSDDIRDGRIPDAVNDGRIPNSVPVFTESTEPHPNAPYAVAKYACEKYIEYAHRSFGLPSAMVRQTNTYGRKDNDFFVVEQIITQMLKNPDEVKLGYQHPWRNFLYIDDMINMWISLINNVDSIDNAELFTIGPPNALSIDSLAQTIASKLDWKGTIKWNEKPPRPGEIFLLNSGYEKIKRFTDWTPEVDLDKGLDLTINIWNNR